ncbi:hypothetical protein JJV70_22220 [Streptomyces sp. JJ66]|nr:hypothetical protein [Streptomyces sp. JJ66]
MFESLADELRDPDTDTLTAALTGAVRTLGTEHIREQLPVFHDLGLEEFFEVTQCWQWAHRLTLSYWYAGARSRTMTAGEVAVCLYLSDLQQCRQAEFRRQPQRALVLARAVHQGADRVPADTLVCLGEGFAAELGGIARDRGTVPKAYRSTMPDYHRRRLCFSLAHADSADQPVPLIVRHNEDDGGGYALGLTAPRQPGRTHFRTLRARW